MNSWVVAVILYLVFAVTYNQCYKLLTQKMKSAGALTVITDGAAGLIALLFIPLFDFKLPENIVVYIFLGLACIFYALNDRLSTTTRIGIEASTYSMLKQFSTVFMIFAGLLFFGDTFVWTKFIGALMIVAGNTVAFYRKGNFKNNKYMWCGVAASICTTIALFLDVNYSREFNLPLYVAFILLVPALLVWVFERIPPKKILEEVRHSNKKALAAVCLSSAPMLILKLFAYELGEVMVVAPLLSLTVILNIIFGYFFLKEKDHLPRKIIAGITITIAIIIIKL